MGDRHAFSGHPRSDGLQGRPAGALIFQLCLASGTSPSSSRMKDTAAAPAGRREAETEWLADHQPPRELRRDAQHCHAGRRRPPRAGRSVPRPSLTFLILISVGCISIRSHDCSFATTSQIRPGKWNIFEIFDWSLLRFAGWEFTSAPIRDSSGKRRAALDWPVSATAQWDKLAGKTRYRPERVGLEACSLTGWLNRDRGYECRCPLPYLPCAAGVPRQLLPWFAWRWARFRASSHRLSDRQR